MIKFVSEESIEEGIYTIALEKLRLEQDLTNEEDGDDGMYTQNIHIALCVIFVILVSLENVKKCVLSGCTITSKTKINVF